MSARFFFFARDQAKKRPRAVSDGGQVEGGNTHRRSAAGNAMGRISR
jgi:hypothetical protein